MTPDAINAGFEGVAAVLLALNVRRAWIDSSLRGVSVWPTIFYTWWGVWNLYFYPALGQRLSFYAGIGVVLMNAVWLAVILWNAVERLMDEGFDALP